ncbi:hypothetical protein PIB30_090260 [Stylosanthes scabra]|uniref:Uncharacterized protein n=1 Tax=Stylosanthes scabra TaxID=79078 RepID=A0ABU6XS21_9FABA|nr:hypothetical protein [Stylosanthes scabra]
MGNQPRQPFHDPNANTYNPGRKNHPNLGWRGNQNSKNGNFQNHLPYQQFQRPPFQPPFQPQQPGLPNLQPKPSQSNSFETALEKLTLKIPPLGIWKLNGTQVNPKGEYKAITLRSGRTLEDVSNKVNVQPTMEKIKEDATRKQICSSPNKSKNQ